MNPEYLTISDYQQKNPDALLFNGISQCFREESQFLNVIRLMTIGRLKAENLRAGAMNQIKNRKIGQDRPVVLHEKPDKVEDSLYIYSNEIKVPKELVDYKDPKNVYDPLAWNIEATSKSMARQICDDVINNTPSENPDAIVGLRYRVDNDLSSDQKIPASGTNGTALDLDPAGANYQQNIRQFKQIMDEAKAQCAGQPTLCLCNQDFIIAQSRIWADSNYLKTTEDSLHRTFEDWTGMKYIDMGYRYNDTDRIIKSYENAYGVDGTAGTDKCTSIYMVTMGEEFWTMMQAEAMKVYDTHLDENNINYVTQFDWMLGQMITHPRSVVRVYGLKMK